MKFVLDTNVIAGFSIMQKGAVVVLWKLLQRKKYTLVTSDTILWEVDRALRYPQLQSRHQWSEARIQVYLATIRYKAHLTAGTAPIDISIADMTDTKFLSCAEETQADAVVTGDGVLLDLRKYKRMPILTPAQCIERFFPDVTIK